jgi:hypothetical protein
MRRTIGWIIKREEREFTDWPKRWRRTTVAGLLILVFGTYLFHDTIFWPVTGGFMAIITILRLIIATRVWLGRPRPQ